MGSGSSTMCVKWVEQLASIPLSTRNRELLSAWVLEKCTENPELFGLLLGKITEFLEAHMDSDVARVVAMHYLESLSSLSERFGAYSAKDTLDALCFRLTDPESYYAVEESLAGIRQGSQKTVAKVLRRFRSLLKEERIAAKVSGRFKGLYSIHRKIQHKQYGHPLELHDIFAFRIVLRDADEQDCTDVLNLFHDRFQPISERFKDYVTIPKINGYQSIHTCLHGILEGLTFPVEVQIRTVDMDRVAEQGYASHWIYARTKRAELPRNTLRKPPRQPSGVYVFSKSGDLFRLLEGATVLDFAYTLHTDVGDRARAAMVNGKMQSLGCRLHEGDRIEIFLAERAQVSPAWVAFSRNPSTLRKIHDHS
jgi:GTP diphosphokinase / guanosine-3',5'-bis(diphosphate) 3'-diphosphatase